MLLCFDLNSSGFIGMLPDRLSDLHAPNPLYSLAIALVRVLVLLRLICQEQFHRSSVSETPTREFNHTSANLLAIFLVLSCVLLFAGRD